MDANEGRGGVDVAEDEGDESFNGGLGWRCAGVAGGWGGVQAFESQDAEVRPARGKIGLGDFLNAFEWHTFILRRGASGASQGV